MTEIDVHLPACCLGEGPSGDGALGEDSQGLSRDAMLCGALLFALLQSAEVEMADEQPVRSAAAFIDFRMLVCTVWSFRNHA